MSFDPTVKNAGTPRILVAPLDWGLGHATRCIPVIYELISQGADVWIAGEGAPVVLLKKEFPQLPFLPLKGYRIQYANSRIGLFWSLIRQVPSIIHTIKHENNWLIKAVHEHGFDAVISDNRYGLYHQFIPSIFITHQLRIKSPFGRLSELILQKRNYKYIKKFTECWVPDIEQGDGLAGELSHPLVKPTIPVYYTGILSRLKSLPVTTQKRHLFISLSGPEPQRSQLENLVIRDISMYNGTVTMVRGLPATAEILPSTNDLTFYNHLPAEAFSLEMQKAEYIISRSGYSTIMDIMQLGKKAILIPTPGQTEQEYLGYFLEKKEYAACVRQQNFSLDRILMKAADFKFEPPLTPANNLPALVASLLQKIKPLSNAKT